jgi:hypothetical protein
MGYYPAASAGVSFLVVVLVLVLILEIPGTPTTRTTMRKRNTASS